MNIFKDIGQQLKEQFLTPEKEEIKAEIHAILNTMYFSATEQDVIKTKEYYHTWRKNLLDLEMKKYESSILALDEIVEYIVGMIKDPINTSLNFNDAVENFKIDPNNKQNNLNRKSMFAFRCATTSIIGLLNNKIQEEEKEEHLIMQQTNLNVASSNNWNGKNEANYWYAVHWFIRGNTDNAKYFLKQYLTSDSALSMAITMTEKKNWISKIIPDEFHNITQELLNQNLEAKLRRNKLI